MAGHWWRGATLDGSDRMQSLEGTVERVTYFNPENGYSVIRLRPARGSDVVTLVGNLPEVTPGETLRLRGDWVAHPEYGRQFKVEHCEQVLPATVEGI
jgi:exodeoxyribonuclease V alpha subunit